MERDGYFIFHAGTSSGKAFPVGSRLTIQRLDGQVATAYRSNPRTGCCSCGNTRLRRDK